ncbi:hypothetical protein [Pseudomonas oryzihabitans]|uniref:DUF5872 domain-containing protein n=1 Tax=Pseudomonas oryzihabitans TaxID=47885 RepID=A0A2Z5A6Q9_9PSED|nr:hypothetical protein [Pseudomonas oryzihabitans]AXA65732.1 hypothetical protein CE139_07875 [Pseudomonas oryzihabitans]
MSATAKKSDPELWEKVKKEITEGDKGGKPGQWSARKAQLASQEYQKRGGEYQGGKGKDNHLQQWTDEKWDTRSGKKSEETGERYLPEKARDSLSKEEYQRTTVKKRRDTRRGQQHSKQPADVARKTAAARESGLAGLTKDELMKRAARREVRGRSRMKKDELVKALQKAGEK